MAESTDPALTRFIDKWLGREGGQERANYALFLKEFCDALRLPDPRPNDAASATNDYVFEREVLETRRDGTVSRRRIDLYKRDCFVLEAKQSRLKPDSDKAVAQPGLFLDEPAPRGRRGAARAWDVLMLNARAQAEGYVRLLPEGHEPPPFVIVCDVGHCFEIYANFRRDGKAFDQFPDRRSFRIHLEELRDPEKRALLAAIWTDPLALDPAKTSARVTREIAERLAAVSRSLENAGHHAEDVAMFLMRCLFTMFAEDVGLLRKDAFLKILEACEKKPETFPHKIGQLWEAMDTGGFAHALEERVARFNGTFFKNRAALPLSREDIGELKQAARYDWREVDPSIFGALLEQALDPKERRRLGAHFTPRAYVERLVVATVIEPLRADWENALGTIERQKSEGRRDAAIATVAAFHEKLCATRVLDPACGTGNFLYVALELLKRLEGEVLEALVDLGGQEALTGLEGHSVGPQQFLGMEINPRAKAIAELVLWIGHLQWHVRTRTGLPSEPILRAYDNIVTMDAVLDAEKLLKRDEKGKPVTRRAADGEAMEVYDYRNPRRPEWPEAEFIVGNPPFIGKGEPMRAALGNEYIEALGVANPLINRAADFVMYWWDHAADLLIKKDSPLRRFGFVTTNSIGQIFNRRVVERHLDSKEPISIIMATADHPWTKASSDSAAVRIAMTVCEAGNKIGAKRIVTTEAALDSDTPIIEFHESFGRIHSDLSLGVDLASAAPLLANEGLTSMGPALGGRGFVVTSSEAQALGATESDGWLRPLTTGKDITAHHRQRLVIDVREFENEIALRTSLPKVYQHLRMSVYSERQANSDPRLREFWWRYRRSNELYFSMTRGLSRFIATVETTKHRIFLFTRENEILEHGVIGLGSDDALHLGVLSSRTHVVWTLAQGGTLEDRPRYNKSRCFDPFPFPATDDLQKHRIRQIAEELDAHRKRVLAEHPRLTLTGLYNVLEKLRAGVAVEDLAAPERVIFDDGLVLILKELHEKLDAAVAAAYGWPADLGEEDILSRLVALNRERAAEEARGLVRWLRPEYQIPRFGAPADRTELDLGAVAARAAATAPKPAFPTDDHGQTAAVVLALAAADGPRDIDALAAQFRQGRRVRDKIEAVLAALARTGLVATLDGGRRYALRRVA